MILQLPYYNLFIYYMQPQEKHITRPGNHEPVCPVSTEDGKGSGIIKALYTIVIQQFCSISGFRFPLSNHNGTMKVKSATMCVQCSKNDIFISVFELQAQYQACINNAAVKMRGYSVK